MVKLSGKLALCMLFFLPVASAGDGISEIFRELNELKHEHLGDSEFTLAYCRVLLKTDKTRTDAAWKRFVTEYSKKYVSDAGIYMHGMAAKFIERTQEPLFHDIVPPLNWNQGTQALARQCNCGYSVCTKYVTMFAANATRFLSMSGEPSAPQRRQRSRKHRSSHHRVRDSAGRKRQNRRREQSSPRPQKRRRSSAPPADYSDMEENLPEAQIFSPDDDAATEEILNTIFPKPLNLVDLTKDEDGGDETLETYR